MYSLTIDVTWPNVEGGSPDLCFRQASRLYSTSLVTLFAPHKDHSVLSSNLIRQQQQSVQSVVHDDLDRRGHRAFRISYLTEVAVR